MATSDMTLKRKDMDSIEGDKQEEMEASKLPRIEISSKTIKIMEDRDPSRYEMNMMLTGEQLVNIGKYSDYLREVIALSASSSDNDQEGRIILLKEKDVSLAAQLLLILAQFKDEDRILPNLSCNLGLADLASKWIVGVFVTHFQYSIQATLTKLCDANRQPIVIASTAAMVSISSDRLLYPAGTSGSAYCSDDAGTVVERCTNAKEWRLRLTHYEFKLDVTEANKVLYRCSGEWKFSDYFGLKYYSGPTSCPFMFKLELICAQEEEEFINIVKFIQVHAEYRHGTIFATDKLSAVIYKHPHLRSEKILTELMTRDDLIQYSLLVTSNAV
jgi:hypothetical protein